MYSANYVLSCANPTTTYWSRDIIISKGETYYREANRLLDVSNLISTPLCGIIIL